MSFLMIHLITAQLWLIFRFISRIIKPKRQDFSHESLLNLTEGPGDVESSSVINEKNPNQSLNKFYNILTEKLDHFCLYRNPMGKRHPPRKSCINESLSRLPNEKNRLYKIKIKYTTEINIMRFKNYKNLLVRILRESERAYYENSFQNSVSP